MHGFPAKGAPRNVAQYTTESKPISTVIAVPAGRGGNWLDSGTSA